MLRHMKKSCTVSVVVIFGFLFTSQAHAKLLFEGWFQVLVGTEKIGYLVERYEFDDNKFKCVTYLKTNSDGNNVTESLKAESGPDLAPLNYQYTSKTGDQVKVIDAVFKADTMSLSIFDGAKKTQTTKRIKKGTFLSEFLMYLILSQKNGLKVGNDFKYNAIAEEEGTAYTGSVIVKNKEPVKGKEAYRLLNEFKGEKYFTWVTPLGEPLLVRQPDRNLDIRFSETQGEATEGLPVNKKDLALLFGKIPGETPSPVPAPAAKKSVASPPAAPGNGIEIKPPPVTVPATDDH